VRSLERTLAGKHGIELRGERDMDFEDIDTDFEEDEDA